jgi:hypothetical protein
MKVAVTTAAWQHWRELVLHWRQCCQMAPTISGQSKIFNRFNRVAKYTDFSRRSEFIAACSGLEGKNFSQLAALIGAVGGGLGGHSKQTTLYGHLPQEKIVMRRWPTYVLKSVLCA